jgi:hypothetical protein
MNNMNYIGLDIHKKSISCCVRQADGTIIQKSTIAATRHTHSPLSREGRKRKPRSRLSIAIRLPRSFPRHRIQISRRSRPEKAWPYCKGC